MPSHGVPQGSSDCPQLGGRFSHWYIKARSITAVFCSMLLISTKKLVFVAIRWRDVYWECLQIQQMSFYLIISLIWRCYFFISLKNIVGFIFYMIKYFVKQWFRKKKNNKDIYLNSSCTDRTNTTAYRMSLMGIQFL